jgi:threonine/homoserine efflux transporter RhtA
VRRLALRSGRERRPRCAHPLQASEDTNMNLHLTLAPIIALLAGILILVKPRLLNYIVAVYLIVIGVLGLVGSGRLG